MGVILNLLFRRKPFCFGGFPARFRGVGHELTTSCVHTYTAQKEPMLVHCIPGYVSTMYLVQYPQRSQFLLLDCGCPSDIHRIKFFMENVLSSPQWKTSLQKMPSGKQLKCGREVEIPHFTIKKHLQLAVLSHCHIDHSGSAGAYHREGISLVQPKGIENSYTGVCGRFDQLLEASVVARISRRMGRTVYENPLESSSGLWGPYWTFPAHAEYDPLVDGSTLPLGFDDWSAVRITGHTTHMIGLYHRPSALFYLADLFVKLKRGYFPPFPIDYDCAYRHSLERVRDLEVRCILMPHGGIIDLTSPRTTSTTPGTQLTTAWAEIVDEVLEQLDRRSREKTKNPFSNMSFFFKVSSAVYRWVIANGKKRERDWFTAQELDNGPLPRPDKGELPPVTIIGGHGSR